MFVKDGQRVGGWLPPTQEALESWLTRRVALASERDKELHPVIEEFRELIDTDPIVRLYMTEMIAQVPTTKPYSERHLKSVDQMLGLINDVITEGPEFNETELSGAPLNAILDWAMGTPAGFAAFRNDRVNAIFKKILTVWKEFLDSPKSLYVLNESETGWKCKAAIEGMGGMDQYIYDPKDKYWGYKSWNDFFTRTFKPGQRPIASPDDDKVIVSGCESTPYAIKNEVKQYDNFWIKGQPYSLQDMLANDESVPEFVGGTIYQAFLSSLNYHRWHSPVAGTIKKAFVQPGTYYSETEAEGMDPAGPNDSQGYIAQVATRALFFIEADDPAIELMCMMPVGMAEISSCEINPKIKPGYHVKKGEEIGCFKYGGSTHCLVFRPGVIKEFAPAAKPQPGVQLMHMGSYLATAVD